MNIDDVVTQLCRGRKMTLREKCEMRKKVKLELRDVCSVSDTAVRKWDDKNRIPEDRLQQIASHYHIDLV